MKLIHFIGICGVAMSALALAFKRNGWTVTGSDKGFFPPVSTELKKAGISFYPGWHPEKMIANGVADCIVVGNVAGSENPEWQYAQEHSILCLSYPEIVAKELIRPQSIVCAGTYGKTTTSALLAWILHTTGYTENHLFGGVAINDFPAAHISSDAQWSVVEGDEYPSARWDRRPKFAHYRPTHLLLTAVEWDHADVYPTKDAYKQAFATLTQSIDTNGLIVACTDNQEVSSITSSVKCSTIYYGKKDDAQYVYFDIQETKDKLLFFIRTKNVSKPIAITSPLLGGYMAENITGCFAMAHQIGVPIEKIVEATATFKGLKRRLEKRYAGDVTVIDDIAHSPAKVASLLATLRQLYSGKIFIVFEPNTGNRKPVAAPSYANAFRTADEVVVPRLSPLKKDLNDKEEPFDEKQLSAIIGKTHPHVRCIADDAEVVDYLVKKTKKNDVIVFAGSHGFRGMIESVIKKYENT